MAACGRGTADVPAIFINALCVSRFWLIIKLFPLPAYKTCAMIIYKYLINCNGLSTFLTLSCFVFVSVSFLLLLLLLSLLSAAVSTVIYSSAPAMASNGRKWPSPQTWAKTCLVVVAAATAAAAARTHLYLLVIPLVCPSNRVFSTGGRLSFRYLRLLMARAEL